jgi:hypothetical protein
MPAILTTISLVIIAIIIAITIEDRYEILELRDHLDALSKPNPAQIIILMGTTYYEVAQKLNSREYANTKIISKITYSKGKYTSVIERRMHWDVVGERYA